MMPDGFGTRLAQGAQLGSHTAVEQHDVRVLRNRRKARDIDRPSILADIAVGGSTSARRIVAAARRV
jgi:hypothetical protein